MKSLHFYNPPLHNLRTLRCEKCSIELLPKSIVYSDEPSELYNNLWPTVMCSGCGLNEHVTYQIQSAAESDGHLTLTKALQQIVRNELKKILKEETADPNGTFSPAP